MTRNTLHTAAHTATDTGGPANQATIDKWSKRLAPLKALESDQTWLSNALKDIPAYEAVTCKLPGSYDWKRGDDHMTTADSICKAGLFSQAKEIIDNLEPSPPTPPDNDGPNVREVKKIREERKSATSREPVSSEPAHPFAHLGPAPYTFINAECADDRRFIMAERKNLGLTYSENTAGSCDHCGMCIHDFYYFEDADGKRFKVGSTCYEKGLLTESHYEDAKALRQAAQAKRTLTTRKRHTREARTLTAAVEFFKVHQDELDDAPHPSFKGKSLNEYVSWMWGNAGTAGKLKAYKLAKKTLKG